MTCSYLQTPDELTIVYEDNGIGIPSDENREDFRYEYGKSTGLGLFLCREILTITISTIKETGDEGSGARFEITVPWEKFRFWRE